MALIWVLLATSLNLTNGYGGRLNLGLGAFYGMGGYTAALLSIHWAIPWWLTVPSGGLAGALLGIVVSIPCMRLWGAYLAIATICCHYVVQWFWINLPVFGGATGLKGVAPFSIHLGNLINFDFVSNISKYYLILSIVILCLVIIYRIIKSPLGKTFVALREDEFLAEMIGIDTVRQKVVCFAIGAFFMGVAGALYVHMLRVSAPESFTVFQTIAVLTMIVIGGSGTFIGPIIGAVVYVAIQEGLRGMQEFSLVVYGALLIVFLILLPRGLIGLWNRLWWKLRDRIRPRTNLMQGEIQHE